MNLLGTGRVSEQEGGEFYAPVLVEGATDNQKDYSVVNVGEGVTLQGWAGIMIDYNSAMTAYGVVVNVDGTLCSVCDASGSGGHALYINGSIAATEGNIPQIILDGATLTTEQGNGMYLAGYAETTIRGSTITSNSEGGTGIEIRAGKLTITDSTVTGGTGKFEAIPNGNGSTTANVALAVVQHTTELPLEVTINSGEFTGGAALFQQNVQKNEDEAVATIKLDVRDGNFVGQVYSENVEDFISGGTFSGDVSDYLAEEVDLIANSDGTYSVDELDASNAAAVVTDASGTSTTYYGTLAEAINAAQTGDTVTARRNLTSNTTLNIATGITLDLDGNTLTITGPMDNNGITVSPTAGAATHIAVTIQDGTITDARGKDRIATGRNTVCAIGAVDLTTRDLTVEAYAPQGLDSPYYNYLLRICANPQNEGGIAAVGTLTVDSGTTLRELSNGSAETYGVVGIAIIGAYTNNDVGNMGTGYQGVSLIVEDGAAIETTGYAICGNGTAHGTTITINGGDITSTGSAAIYHPQNGTLTVNGGVLTGQTGIQFCSGQGTLGTEFALNGGTVRGVGPDERETKGPGDGLVSDGAAISLVNRSYPGSTPSVTISDGTYTSACNDAVIAYTWANAGASGWSEAGKHLKIEGGTFSSDPSDYVVPNKIALIQDNGMYIIADKGDEAAEVVAGEPDVALGEGIPEYVGNAVAGIEADGLTGEANHEANSNDVTEADGKEALQKEGVTVDEGDNVTIVVQPYLDITVTGYSANAETTTPNTMTLDITPMVRTVATTANVASDPNAEIILKTESGKTQNAVQIGTAEELTVRGSITLTIPLPSGFANENETVYIQHKDIYEYTAKVENGTGTRITFVNPHGFSVFTVSTSSAAVAKVGGTSYISLQAAVDAVKNNGTITLKQSNPGTAVVSRVVTFDVNVGGHTFDRSNITAASGYTLSGSGNHFVVTRTPVTPVDPDDGDDNNNSGSSSSVRRYNIEADAGRGGEITPDGRVRVRRGENQTFRITADDGWEIADVEVDGESVGAVERYTFENVRTDHTISATFRQIVTEPEEPETPALPFTDVSEGDWYYDAVAYCWENGIMDGTSSVSFAPNLLLNRAMMAQVLYNLAGGTASTVAGFPDVSPTAWYADAVNWAAANGYVTGYDNGSYGPEDNLTREQMAAILYRYAGSPAPAGSLDGFADAASASAYAVDALRWAVGEGLLTGKDGGRLDPTGTASRAELAQILARFAQM